MMTVRTSIDVNGRSRAAASNVRLSCRDGKVHVRLREYDREETVHGVVEKLTFLITHLIANAGWMLAGSGSSEESIALFSRCSRDLAEVEMCLKAAGVAQDGVLITPCYRKKPGAGNGGLGGFADGASVLTSDGSAESFVKALGLGSLEEYLLDDSVDVVVARARGAKQSYAKFVRRMNRKPVRKERREAAVYPLF